MPAILSRLPRSNKNGRQKSGTGVPDVRTAPLHWDTPAVRVLLLVNPNATRVTPERQRVVEGILGDAHDLTAVHTEARDHATKLAHDAVDAGYECVVVMAGDGTLNEAAAALAGTGCALACLPSGSTNVFSRTIGLPDDLAAAARLVSRAMTERRCRRIGLGSVNGRPFLLHVGIGWDAEVVSIVERHSPWKRRIGHLLYVYSGLMAFFGTYDRRRPHFSVCSTSLDDGDGETVPDGFFALVLNSDPYTFVHRRPFVVSPGTSFDDPLTLVVARSMRTRRFIRLPLDALGGRTGVRPRTWVTVRTEVGGVTVSRLDSDPLPSMPYQVDGDHLGEADELRFRHHPDAITILEPRPGHLPPPRAPRKQP
jgi:diacylglycerol kinase family enzyme